MKTMLTQEIDVVAGGWGAKNECTKENGFDPETQDCFDGGPRPKKEKPGKPVPAPVRPVVGALVN